MKIYNSYLYILLSTDIAVFVYSLTLPDIMYILFPVSLLSELLQGNICLSISVYYIKSKVSFRSLQSVIILTTTDGHLLFGVI